MISESSRNYRKWTQALCPQHCDFYTPSNRKRRNSLDSMRGLSARQQISKIHSILNSEPKNNLLEDRLSQLLDKITQVDNSCKLQLQSLSASIMKLETENDNIKMENNKLLNEIRNFKGKLKSFEQSFREKLSHYTADLTHSKEATLPTDSEHDYHLSYPDDLPLSTVSLLFEKKSPPLARTSHNHCQHSMRLHPPQMRMLMLFIQLRNLKISTHLRRAQPNMKLFYSLIPMENILTQLDSCPTKHMSKIFCPTISSVTKTLTDTSLGRTNHIIIHVGTNAIARSSLHSCQTQFQTMIDVVSQKYSSSKVLISSLLKHHDDIEHC